MPLGTVKERLGSLSQVTAPEDSTLTNLYSKDLPGARLREYVQRWLESVYLAADMAGALSTDQLPSSGIDPTTLMVWPYLVVTISLKVTSTLLSAQAELVPVADVVVLVAVDKVVDDTGGVDPLSPPSLSPDSVTAMSAQLR